MSSLGVLPWGQGVPLPIVFSRRYALGRAPTRGAPTYSLLHYALGRASPTNCLLQALCPGEGTHKGCPYRLSSPGVMPWGGRPQGVPLRPLGAPLLFSRRYALGRAPTRGAPTDCLLSALCPGEGTHKGCPYRFACPGEGAQGCPYRFAMPWGGRPQGVPLPIRCPAMPWGGHPQGVPLPIRYALGRAPTRGAPTRFRQPHVGYSQFDAIALQEDQSLLHEVQARGRMTSSQQSSGTN